MTRGGGRGAVLAVAALALAAPLGAQGLAERVTAVQGEAVFRMELRDGVEVCENGIRTVDGQRRFHWNVRDGREETVCSEGLAEVVVTVRRGQVRDIELEPWEGTGSSPERATDLGRFGGFESAAFLVSLARSPGIDEGVAKEGMMAATMARDARVWPDLLDVARDRGLDSGVRRSAVFWLGQEAADVATGGLADLARDDSEDQDVRDAAVFALSQRPDDESVPLLMELARTARESRTRRTAMFWLAQADDPRVVDFFEELLVGRSGG